MSTENGSTIQQMEGVRADLSNISYAFRKKPKKFNPKIGMVPNQGNNIPGGTSTFVSGAFLDREMIMPETSMLAPEVGVNSPGEISVLDMQQIDIGLGSEIAVGMSSGVAIDMGQAENAMGASSTGAPTEAVDFGANGPFEITVETAFSVQGEEIESSASTEAVSENAEIESSDTGGTDSSTNGESSESGDGDGENE